VRVTTYPDTADERQAVGCKMLLRGARPHWAQVWATCCC